MLIIFSFFWKFVKINVSLYPEKYVQKVAYRPND